ncbi:MAG: PEGA domain-containing protein [Myxococcota bacterium]
MYKKGIAAYDAQNWAEARTQFAQAYAITQHPTVLLNLAQAELRAGYPEDAGNHLTLFLETAKEAKPEERALAEKGVNDAKSRTASIQVSVSEPGAGIYVNGTTIGNSPRPRPYFLKPGKHQLMASKDGRTAVAEVLAYQGRTAPVTLTLAAPPPAAPPPVVAPPPAYPPSYSPATNMPSPPPDQGTGGRQPFVDWYLNSPGAWVLTGVAGLGVVGTFVGIGVAADRNGAVGDIQDQILAEATRRGLPSTQCGPEDNAALDSPDFAQACGQLRDAIDDRDTGLIVLGVSAGVAGAAAIGTVVYYFVDSDGKGSSSDGAFTVTPIVGPQIQGGQLSLRF